MLSGQIKRVSTSTSHVSCDVTVTNCWLWIRTKLR